MNISIRWHRTAMVELWAHVQNLSGAIHNRREYFRILVAGIEQHLRKNAGRPPESAPMENVEPEARSWEVVASEIWILFVVREQGGLISRLLGRSGIDVVIRQSCNRLPTLADL